MAENNTPTPAVAAADGTTPISPAPKASDRKSVQMYITLTAIAVLIAYTLYKVLGTDNLIDKLSEPAAARGLITFVVTLGTVGIALLVVFGALLGDGTDESRNRFHRAKEVLTLLIGVLGTVIGFYFGTGALGNPDVAGKQAPQANPPAVVQEVVPTDSSVSDDEPVASLVEDE